MEKYAICTIIKNEHRYICEWIDYNISIGFDAIHLYEDNGSKSHKDLLSKYPNVFIHQWSECPKINYTDRDYKQVTMMQHFIDTYKNEYDWVAFIDIDEFIRFEEGYNLHKLCNEFNKHDAIYLQWKMIGASGHITRPLGMVQDNYFNCDKELNPNYVQFYSKSLCNLHKRCIINNVHKIKYGVFTDGANANNRICRKKSWIDHYFTKSLEDWVERFTTKGDVVNGNRDFGEFLIYNKWCKLEDILPKVIGLNLGCGKNKLSGWLNTDIKDVAIKIDATKNLPISDETIKFAYSEHMVEHLTREEGKHLFEELYRVLKPKGVFRLVLPTQEMFSRVTQEYIDWHFDTFGEGERTLENLKERFCTMWGHKSIYTVAELTKILQDIGFNVEVCEINKSKHKELMNIEHHGDIIGEYNNNIETTVIEATK